MQTFSKRCQISRGSVHYLDKFGLYLAVRGNLLVCQHVSVALRQGLLTGCRHLDGVGDDGLQNCTQVHAGGGLVVHPLLPASRAGATVQRPHRRRRLRSRWQLEKKGKGLHQILTKISVMK